MRCQLPIRRRKPRVAELAGRSNQSAVRACPVRVTISRYVDAASRAGLPDAAPSNLCLVSGSSSLPSESFGSSRKSGSRWSRSALLRLLALGARGSQAASPARAPPPARHPSWSISSPRFDGAPQLQCRAYTGSRRSRVRRLLSRESVPEPCLRLRFGQSSGTE